MFARQIPRFALRAALLLALVGIFGLSLQDEFGSLSVPNRVVSTIKAKAITTPDRTGLDLAVKEALENPFRKVHIFPLGFDQHQTLPRWLIIASRLIRSPPFTVAT
jgi:hypothetical protein